MQDYSSMRMAVSLWRRKVFCSIRSPFFAFKGASNGAKLPPPPPSPALQRLAQPPAWWDMRRGWVTPAEEWDGVTHEPFWGRSGQGPCFQAKKWGGFVEAWTSLVVISILTCTVTADCFMTKLYRCGCVKLSPQAASVFFFQILR